MATFKKTDAPARKQRLVAGGTVPVAAPLGTFLVVAPLCKVCNHPNRREIDMMLALGWSQRECTRYWNDLIEAETGDVDFFSKSGMGTHAQKHLSVKDAAIVRIIEERARLEGMDVEAVRGFILTKQAVAEAIVHRGLELMQRDDAVVEPKDVLAALDLLMRLEEKRSVVAEETMLREIRAFMNAVRRNVDESLLEQIYADYRIELGEVPPAVQLLPPDEEDDDGHQ